MIDNILQRLDKVKKTGKGYQARCPAHDDKSPSLSLREGDDGRVLLHCHAGCATADVVAAMGMTLADLFAPSGTPRRPPPAAGISRRELQVGADDERDILFFIKCDAKYGRPISQTDMRRGQLALQRIKLAGRFA